MPDVLEFLKEWLGKKARILENGEYLFRVGLRDIDSLLALGRAALEMAELDEWLMECDKCTYDASYTEYGRDGKHHKDCPREMVSAIAQELYDDA